MKIAVVGPGAIGCLFGAMLSRGGHEVWLIDRRPDRARLLDHRGIWVSGVSGEFNARVRATASPKDAREARLVVIAVKAFDTRGAAQVADALTGAGTAILTLQNGLGNIEVLQEVLGNDRVIGGVTSQAATLIAPGQVHHAGQGATVIGEPSGELTERLTDVTEAFASAGVHASLTTDLDSDVWSKLAVNAGINAVATLAQVRNGGILESRHLREMLSAAATEVSAVAKAKSIALTHEDVAAYAQEMCQRTANNVNSMLQDVHRRRRTEIDAINGAVLREGEAVGVPTPTNRVLTALVRGLEDTYGARLTR
ncbi:MAG: 2-dehydropantoate 2-reductase [Armatimonadota bacterium]|nr:MAG: 2-dehydropantoate 2-reductase [Armatimonadota bacterium]